MDDGTIIQVYDIAGRQLASGLAVNGTAVVTTTLTKGDTAIIHIGGKSVNVMLY